jgi:hypothetical protein
MIASRLGLRGLKRQRARREPKQQRGRQVFHHKLTDNT